MHTVQEEGRSTAPRAGSGTVPPLLKGILVADGQARKGAGSQVLCVKRRKPPLYLRLRFLRQLLGRLFRLRQKRLRRERAKLLRIPGLGTPRVAGKPVRRPAFLATALVHMLAMVFHRLPRVPGPAGNVPRRNVGRQSNGRRTGRLQHILAIGTPSGITAASVLASLQIIHMKLRDGHNNLL